MRKQLSAESSFSNDVDWYRGGPEVVLSYEVHPGLRAEFRLARYKADRIDESVEIGVVERIPGNAPVKSQIQIGSSGPKQEEGASERGFTSLFLHGRDTTATLHGVSDFDEWDITSNGYGTLVFDKPARFSFPIAYAAKSENPAVESIRLEIVSREDWAGGIHEWRIK